MLKIRKEQYEELGKISLKRFEDSMVEHIREFFPGHYALLGEPTIRKVIQYGVEKAEKYGFTTKRNVCLYIDVMFMLGSNFDTDIQYSWVAESLGNASTGSSNTRIDRLCDITLKYLDRVSGVNDGLRKRALLSVREIPVQNFPVSVTRNAESGIISQLRTIWPSKYEDMGEAIARQLIRRSLESAKRYNIASDRGLLVFVVLMFILGSGFDNDPQFLWASEVLNDESFGDETRRVDDLYKKAMSFLETCLSWKEEDEG